MLDKDQYNQEEYNDYYQQETRGAEISSSEESSSKKGILILLGLVVLAVAGYFGYKTLSPSAVEGGDDCVVTQQESNSTEPIKAVETNNKQSDAVKEPVKTTQSIKKEEKSSEPKLSTEDEKKINNIVKESVQQVSEENPQKMTPEQVSKVVQLVMSQMNKPKTTAIQESDSKTKTDTELMSALSGTDVDSVNNDKVLEESLSKIDERKNVTIEKNSTTVNTYNKVNIEEHSGDDELSKLSGQISNLISDKKTSDQTNGSKEEKTYTENLKKEVVIRKNEMRIIIVKKGDTLGKIAKRAYGNVMEYKKIYKANPDILNRPDRIYIGQKIRIPK